MGATTPASTVTSSGSSRRHRLLILIALPIALLAFGLSASFSSSAASPGWELILDRPTPDFRAIDFVSASEGWLAASTGLLHTTDGGASWEEAVPIGGLDVDMADGEHGWLVGLSGAIYHTSDGAAWPAQTSGTDVHLSDVHAVSAQEAWAAGAGAGFSDAISFPLPTALLHTEDGGATWEQVETPAGAWFREVTFVGEQGWALGTFRCPPEQPDPPGECEPFSNMSMLLHTSDGGETWAPLATELPESMRDLVFVDELRGWVLGETDDGPGGRDTVLHTKDGGLTWEVQLSTQTSFDALAFESAQVGWVYGRDCSEFPCPHLLFRTVDGGATWDRQEVAINPLRPGAISMVAGDAALYAVGSDLALRSTDGGETLAPMDHPALRINRIEFATQDVGYASSRHALLRTDNAGRDWLRVGPGPGDQFALLDFLDVDHGFAAGSQCDDDRCGAAVRETLNGGASWTEVFFTSQSSGGVRAPFTIDLSFADDSHGWLVTDATIFVTADGGSTWEPNDFGPSTRMIDAVLVDSTSAWAAVADLNADSYRLLHSTDGARTWDLVRRLPAGTRLKMAFADDAHGWYTEFVCDGPCHDKLFVTEDSGESWREADLERIRITDIALIDPLNGWISGTRCGDTGCAEVVIHTADGGHTWTTQISGDRIAGQLEFVDVETGWLVPNVFFALPGGPPERTLIYHTSDAGGGPIGREEPTPDIKFPIVGGQTRDSGGASVQRAVLLLATVAAMLGTGTILARARRRR